MGRSERQQCVRVSRDKSRATCRALLMNHVSCMHSETKPIPRHVKRRNITERIMYSQLFPGEEHAFVFPAHYEAEMWKLCVRPVASDVKYFVREHTQ